MIDFLKKQLSQDASPLVQFIKYGIAGGAATATNILVFFLAGWFLFPCLNQEDIVVKLLHLTAPIAASAESPVPHLSFLTYRALYADISSTIGFIVSNIFCYLLNRIFVFKPGRHTWVVEFLLFFAVSGISFFLGTAIQTLLITKLSMQTTLAFGANLVTALLINYAARKFFIFKG